MADPIYLAGGGGLFRAFRIGKVTTSGVTSYQIQKADGSAAATATTDAALTLVGSYDQVSMTPDSNGAMKINVSNYDVSSLIIAYLNTFAKDTAQTASAAPPSFINDVGAPQGPGAAGSVGSRPLMFYQVYGPPGIGDDDGTRLMTWGIAGADMSSGPIVYKAGQLIKPDIIMNGVKAEFPCPIATALWDTGYLGSVGSLTVPQFSPYERDYLAMT